MMKVVMKLELRDDKGKQKAMRTVSGLSGVESIAMDTKEKKLTVTGDVDPVTLVPKLRKICKTEILSVGPAKEPEKKQDESKKGDDKKKDSKDEVSHSQLVNYQAFYNQHHQNPYPHYLPPVPAYYSKSVEEDPNACVIC